jgi:hypothetical protein
VAAVEAEVVVIVVPGDGAADPQAGGLGGGAGLGGGEQAFAGAGFAEGRGAHELLVEDHGGELLVRTVVVPFRERLVANILGHATSVSPRGRYGQGEAGSAVRGSGAAPGRRAGGAARGRPGGGAQRTWPSPVTT